MRGGSGAGGKPARNRKIYVRLNRLLSALLVVLIILGASALPALADETKDSDASFYKMASVASSYLSDQMAKGSSDGSGVNLPFALSQGAAGGLLGYSDEADQHGIVMKWFMSALSNSSASFSYSALSNISADDGSGNPLYVYCKYGQLLNMVGFDQTGTDSSMTIGRFAGGGILLFGYWAAGLVPNLFRGMVSILQVLNPFRFVNSNHPLADASSVGMYATDGGTGNTPMAKNNPFGVIAAYLTRIYNTLYDNFVWLIIGFLFVVMVSRLLFSNINGKGAKNWIRIKNFIFRSVMMVLGVPLIGMLYTDCLGALSDDIGEANIPANKIVMSTLLDFETWAHELRLAIPADGAAALGLNNIRATVSSYTYANLRSTCYNINAMSFNSMIASRGGFWPETTFSTESLTGGTSDASMANAMAGWNEAARDGDDGVVRGRQTASELIYDMIHRYMSGTFYYAGSYESDVKGDWSYDDVKSTVEAATGTVKDFEKLAESFDSDKLFGSVGGDGTLVTVGGCGAAVDETTQYLSYNKPGGLSIMAMYNYLNSKFDAANVVVYSSEKASSGLVRESHYSVNLIGGNTILSFLYWLNAVLMLFGLVILGGFYAFSMIFSAFKRLFHAVPAMFGTVVGSLQMAAKLLIIAVTALFEIIGTMIMYSMASDLLLSIDRVVMMPIIAMSGTRSTSWETTNGAMDVFRNTTGAGTGLNVTLTIGMVCIMLVVSCILYVLFLMTAMRARKGFVSYMDKAASSFIESLFGVRVDQTPDAPGALARLGQGVMGGLGAGAMARMAMGDNGDQRSASGEASEADGDKDGNANGEGGGNNPDGNGDAREGKAGDSNGGSGDGTDNPDNANEGNGAGSGAGFEESSEEEDEDRELAGTLTGAESLSGTGSGTSGELDTPEESGGSPDGTPEAGGNGKTGNAGTGERKDPKAAERENREDRNANNENGGDGGAGQTGGPKDAPKDKKDGKPEEKPEAGSGGPNGGNGRTRELKPGDPGYTGSPEDRHENDGSEFIRDDEGEGTGTGGDPTKTKTEGSPDNPEQGRPNVPQRTLSPGERAMGGRKTNAAGGRGNNDGLSNDGRQANNPEGRTVATGPDGKPVVPGEPGKTGQPEGTGTGGEPGRQGRATDGTGNPAEAPKPVAPAEPGGTNGGTPANAGQAGRQSPEAGSPETPAPGPEAEAVVEPGAPGEAPKPVETAEEQQAVQHQAPAPAPGSGGRRTLSGAERVRGNVNANGTGIGGNNPSPEGTGGARTAGPGTTATTDPKAPGVPLSPGSKLSSVADPQAHGIEETVAEPGPAPVPAPAQETAVAEPVPVTAGNVPNGRNTESGGHTPPPTAGGPAGPQAGRQPGQQSGQSAGQTATGGPAGTGETRTARQAPPAGATRQVTGTIDGHAAEGTATLNADGSTTVSMHRTDPAPSLSATKEEAGIVSAGLEGGPGKGGPRQLSDAQKIAGMAAMAAFMSGFTNDFVRNMGQAMQYGVASELTDEVLHGRRTPIPKYGPSTGGRRRPAPPVPGRPSGGKPNAPGGHEPPAEQPRDILDGTPEEQAEAEAKAAELARKNKAAQDKARREREEARRKRREAKRTRTLKYDNKDPNKRGGPDDKPGGGPAGTRK